MAKLNLRAAETCHFDFLALGAIVQRLDPGLVPLHEADRFQRYCSGAEYNPAANLAKCFRKRTAVASACVHYPPGWWVESEVRRAGVVPLLKWFDHDGIHGPRIATIYSDRGIGVRAPAVYYDRANEAGAMLAPGDFDWHDYFHTRGARWFHSGGVFTALSATTAELVVEAMAAAQAAGTVTSFDLNFRRKLWTATPGGQERAVELNRRIARHLDVLFANESDLQDGLGIDEPNDTSETSALAPERFKQMIRKAVAAYPNLRLVATTLRQVQSASRHRWSALMWYDGRFFESPTCELDVYDRIGGGDGFAAGLVYGLLEDESPETALKIGWAHGALVTTYPGDITMARLDNVEAVATSRPAAAIR